MKKILTLIDWAKLLDFFLSVLGLLGSLFLIGFTSKLFWLIIKSGWNIL
jgi:hypothetical protein